MQIKNHTGLTEEQWNKRYPNITMEEVCCKCCGLLNINLLFLDKVQRGRVVAGIPFIFTSGCRCEKHNTNIGGKLKSKHLTSTKKKCEAVDISCLYDSDRYIILNALLIAGLVHVGIDKVFLHGDNSKRRAVWIY